MSKRSSCVNLPIDECMLAKTCQWTKESTSGRKAHCRQIPEWTDKGTSSVLAAWREHLATFRIAHPNMTFKEAQIAASNEWHATRGTKKTQRKETRKQMGGNSDFSHRHLSDTAGILIPVFEEARETGNWDEFRKQATKLIDSMRDEKGVFVGTSKGKGKSKGKVLQSGGYSIEKKYAKLPAHDKKAVKDWIDQNVFKADDDDVYNALEWLDQNMGIRLDKYTMTELLDMNRDEIQRYVTEESGIYDQ